MSFRCFICPFPRETQQVLARSARKTLKLNCPRYPLGLPIATPPPPRFYVYSALRRFSRIERCTNRSLKRNIFLRSYKYSNKNVCGTLLAFLEMTLGNAILYVRNRFVHSEIQHNRVYPFAPENFTAKTHFEAIRDLFWSLYGY